MKQSACRKEISNSEKRLLKGTARHELTGFSSVYPGNGSIPLLQHRQVSVHGHKGAVDTPELVMGVNPCNLKMIKTEVPLAHVKELLLPRTLHFRHYSIDHQ